MGGLFQGKKQSIQEEELAIGIIHASELQEQKSPVFRGLAGNGISPLAGGVKFYSTITYSIHVASKWL